MQRYPPIAAGFLDLFAGAPRVSWVDEAAGLFLVHVDDPDHPLLSSLSSAPARPGLAVSRRVVEFPAELPLERPAIPAETQVPPGMAPVCFHNQPSRTLLCRRESSPNRGRWFHTCAATPDASRCSFFRWVDERDQYSALEPMLPTTATAPDTGCVLDGAAQLHAWAGLKQGTDEWMRMRTGRITASTFGSVTGTNHYNGPADLLRQLLWPMSQSSCAMRYGSVNEKAALDCFRRHWVEAEGVWPAFIDEPGIWVSSERTYLAGSPDGVFYECVDVRPTETAFLCRRSLIEIKTPWKLRTREPGHGFYDPVPCPADPDRQFTIPPSYFDQIQGNMKQAIF